MLSVCSDVVFLGYELGRPGKLAHCDVVRNQNERSERHVGHRQPLAALGEFHRAAANSSLIQFA